MSDDNRLERIEIKLDQLTEAMVSLARLDEKTLTLFKRMDTIDAQQAHQSSRLVKLEGSVGSNGASLRFAERLFWIVATAGVGLIFYKMRSGG